MMGTFGEVESPLSASSSKRGSEDEGVMATASLEVLSINSGGGEPHGPTLYEVVYTRGGWIWRSSHRYRDWLALKERLRKEFGTRSLPDDKIFPKKEDMVAVIVKLLGSCQGCRDGGPVGIVEERRRGLQAYFSEILVERRHIWDASEDLKNFFFPGPPTSYSAALSRRRSEQLKGEKLKAKEAAGASAASLMASSLKSTLSSLFEPSPPPAPAPSPSWWQSVETHSATGAAGSPSVYHQAAGGGGGGDSSVVSTPSVLNRLSAKVPSFRDFLFDTTAAASPSQPKTTSHQQQQTPSQSSSRHSATGGGARFKLPSAATTNGAPSESGATDPDGGVSEAGESFNE